MIGSGLAAGSDPTVPTGGHHAITGNKMALTTSIVKDSTYTNQDGTGTTHVSVDEKIYLEK